MKFGSNLQHLRKLHDNMTQEELAERMGVSRQTISKWETD
ncbi:MAG: helix-turn-helix transcriptional regulator, partial [Clostridia bacterium]|nr:helix-turn-helix transcriptional regulator [Clostridia bacterium]